MRGTSMSTLFMCSGENDHRRQAVVERGWVSRHKKNKIMGLGSE